MKLITFTNNSEPENYRIGALISTDEVIDLTFLVTEKDLSEIEILGCFDLDSGFLAKAEKVIIENSLKRLKRKQIKICPPIPRPNKIICIGLNYRDHADESGMAIPKSPIIFSKFATCIIGPNQPILLPQESHQVDYEAEFAFIVGRRAKHVSRNDAMNYVFGYTNFNDVSARDFQFADGQWVRGKSCDTFAPIGEYIATKDEIENPHNLQIQFRLNGKTLQNSNTNQLIFQIPELIEFLSKSITLEPGDIIATGTPPGVGFARKPPIYLQVGDVCEVEIEGLGVLKNEVKG